MEALKYYALVLCTCFANYCKANTTTAKQKLASDPSSGIEPHWCSKEVEDILKQIK